MKLLKSTLILIALAAITGLDAKRDKTAPATAAKASSASAFPSLRNGIKARKDVMDRGLLSKTFVNDMTSQAQKAGLDSELYKNLLQTGRDMHANFPANNEQAMQMLVGINGQIEEAVQMYASKE